MHHSQQVLDLIAEHKADIETLSEQLDDCNSELDILATDYVCAVETLQEDRSQIHTELHNLEAHLSVLLSGDYKNDIS